MGSGNSGAGGESQRGLRCSAVHSGEGEVPWTGEWAGGGVALGEGGRLSVVLFVPGTSHQTFRSSASVDVRWVRRNVSSRSGPRRDSARTRRRARRRIFCSPSQGLPPIRTGAYNFFARSFLPSLPTSLSLCPPPGREARQIGVPRASSHGEAARGGGRARIQHGVMNGRGLLGLGVRTRLWTQMVIVVDSRSRWVEGGA